MMNKILSMLAILFLAVTSVNAIDVDESMAAGNAHSLFLKSDGSLHAMGLNSNGQLGDGSTTNRTSRRRCRR